MNQQTKITDASDDAPSQLPSLGQSTLLAANAGSPQEGQASANTASGHSANTGTAETVEDSMVTLPLLGTAPLRKQVSRLRVFLLLGIALLAASIYMGITESSRSSQRYIAANEALVQAQQLSAASTRAISGQDVAMSEITGSANTLTSKINRLSEEKLTDTQKQILAPAIALQSQIRETAEQVAKGNDSLQMVNAAFQAIEDQAVGIASYSETINRRPANVHLTSRLLTASEGMLNAMGVLRLADSNHETALQALKQSYNAMGNAAQQLRTSASMGEDADIVSAITEVLNLHQRLGSSIETISNELAASHVGRDSMHRLTHAANQAISPLSLMREQASNSLGWPWYYTALVVLSTLIITLSGWLMAKAHIKNSHLRFAQAQSQQLEASSREMDAKRLNDANQAAILRLMNELLLIAEGDLTQEATVTEDITGAIADSVNYTIEELRQLVASVQASANKVTQTTSLVDATSTELLAASTEQLREIRDTGRSVLEMAERINHVSTQAQESSAVAKKSRQAAESGLRAVQDTIGGMNAIRTQIQDSSKRIKRLGESSQEIGEITELISDITEQTNVLALNAAIQAASAGEAGRGFSVVAEEVQRLAERSADATKQIAALVRAIQVDMQDAVAAMERCTAGVVEGAKLSDKAGAAIQEIDQVSRQLSELVEQISDTAAQEATLANQVADNIQHIFAVTEQTGEGTRSTAQQVRELSQTAAELRQSVSRFKIS